MYRSLVAACGGLAMLLAPSAAAAQTAVEAEQDQGVEIQQVPSATSRASLHGALPGQIGTASRESVVRTDQIYRGAKTVQSLGAPSQPSDGRRAYIGRVGGKDRCDRRSKKAGYLAACANVIETRAKEFQPPDELKLTNEQRLLAVRQNIRGPMNTRTLGQQVSEDGSPDTPEGQAVASLILQALAKDQAAADTVAPTQPEETAGLLIPMIVPPPVAP